MSNGFGQPRTALVLGGASEIAHAILKELSAEGGLETAVLAVRSPERASAWLDQHPLQGVAVHLEAWDANDTRAHHKLLERSAGLVGDIDLVLCAVGSLGHNAGISADPTEASLLFQDNFAGPATALIAAAQHLQQQGKGSIVVISSVAGLRARKANFLYGAAKAGLDVFAQGLADSLVDSSVNVHLIRPGFVESKMTTGLPLAPFSTTPDVVARHVAAAVSSSNGRVVHVPRILGPMFGLLRLAPRPVWRRIAGDR